VFETYTSPLTGFTAMLKSTVPTPANAVVGTSVVASIANTSSSGRLKRTAWLQSRASGSFHAPETGSNLTMRPVSGAGSPSESVAGPGARPA
jgi:hypothetical protein